MIYDLNENSSTTNTNTTNSNPKPSKVEDHIKDAEDKLTSAEKIAGHVLGVPRNRDSRSIISKTRQSIFHFPVFISPSLTINHATVLIQYIEKMYASFVENAVANNPYIDQTSLSDKSYKQLGFLNNFHMNEMAEKTLPVVEHPEPIDEWDAIMMEAEYMKVDYGNGVTVEFQRDKCCPKLHAESIRQMKSLLHGLVNESNKEIIGVAPNDIKTFANQIYMAKKSEIIQDFNHNKITEKEKDRRIAEEESKFGIPKPKFDKDGNKIPTPPETPDEIYRRQYNYLRKVIYNNGGSYNLTKFNSTGGETVELQIVSGLRGDGISKVITRDPIPMTKDDPRTELLKPSDVAKLNGMVPYTIRTTFRFDLSNGSEKERVIHIGVKCVARIIQTHTISNNIRDIIINNTNVLNKIRHKTGEISLIDRIFNLSGIKKDAISNLDPNNRWITNLKKMASASKLGGTIQIPFADMIKVPIPNATVVLTKFDVDTIKRDSGINLMDSSIGFKFCRSLNLINLTIVDPVNNIMYIMLPDVEGEFETQSLSTLDNSKDKLDNSELAKEMNKIINR